MYICTCVYIHIYIYIYIYVYMYIYTYIWNMHTYIYIYICICIYLIFEFWQKYVSRYQVTGYTAWVMNEELCIFQYICIYIYIYMNMWIYIYIYVPDRRILKSKSMFLSFRLPETERGWWMRNYVYVNINVYICIYIYKNMWIYIHIYTWSSNYVSLFQVTGDTAWVMNEEVISNGVGQVSLSLSPSPSLNSIPFSQICMYLYLYR